jgi:predicted DNA-binding transcriptional regulator AlpA
MNCHRNTLEAMATMTVQSTGLSREERSANPSRQLAGEAFKQFDCVRSVEETAKILGLGLPTLRSMLARGEGPQVTRLSARRVGIRDTHRQAWLDARAVEALPA